MNCRTALSAILAAGLLLLNTAVASALTITQTASFGDLSLFRTTPLNSSQLLFSTPFSMALFDASLGTLNSVSVNFSADLRMTYTDTVSNPNTTSQAYSLNIIGRVGTSELPTGAGFSETVHATKGGMISGRRSNGSPSTVKFSGSESLSKFDTLFYLEPDLDPFIGTGNFTGSVFAEVLVLNSLDSIGSVTASGDALLEVVYDYTPVPEPGTMVLVGFGMVAVAVYSKRRRSNC